MAKITRRAFLEAGGTAAALAPVGVSSTSTYAQAGARRDSGSKPKNVLFLMSDQHRPHALGIDGDPVAKTPNLDALARTAVRFDNAYCGNPLCAPSRAALLTGTYVHTNGAYSNQKPWPFEYKTMGHHFSSAGYMTAAIGKMHFVDAQTHGFDYRLDFNDWFQYLGPKVQRYAEEVLYPLSGEGLPQIPSLWEEEGDPWTGSFPVDNRLGLITMGGISPLAEKDHFESFVTRESIRFLKEHGKKGPFFLCTSYLRPHDPFTPAPRFVRMFPPVQMHLPSTWGKVDLSTVPRQISERIKYFWAVPEIADPEQAKRYIAMYYANVAEMDDNVGKILGALHELDLDRDTVVVYTSDHGEMLGAHGLWQKWCLYEESVGVPLMFRVPGMTPENKQCKTPVSLVQLLATLAEICGLHAPVGVEGTSFAGNLPDPGRTMDTTVFSENLLGTPDAGFMIRGPNYKYCYYVNDMPELYDLSSDPQEMKNLALLPRYAGKVEEMKAQLFAWHRPHEEV